MRVLDPVRNVVMDKRNGNAIFPMDKNDTGPLRTGNTDKLFTYVELIAKRRGETAIVTSSTGTILETLNTEDSDKTINFIGYDQSAGADNSPVADEMAAAGFNGVHTTAWSDLDGPMDARESARHEALKIEKITIKTIERYITCVDISFKDISRGMSMMRPPYDFLLSTSPPTFYKLRVKGYYGPVVEYILTLSEVPSVQMDSNVWHVEAKFVSVAYRPLGDLNMSLLLMTPYLDHPTVHKKYGSLAASRSSEPRCFHEFFVKAKNFGDSLVSSEVTDLASRISQTDEARKQAANRLTLMTEKCKDIPALSNAVNSNIRGALKEAWSKDAVLSVGEDGYLSAKGAEDSQFPKLKEYVKSLFNKEPGSMMEAMSWLTLLQFAPADLIMQAQGLPEAENPYRNVDGAGTSVSLLRFKNIMKREASRLEGEHNTLKNRQKGNVDDIRSRTLGSYTPLVGPVMKLLCDDVDLFFNVLHDVVSEVQLYHDQMYKAGKSPVTRSHKNTGGVLKGKLKSDRLYAFPSYVRMEVDGNVNRPVMVCPPKVDEGGYRYPEVEFVEKVYKAMLRRNSVGGSIPDGALDETLKNEIYADIKFLADNWVKGIPAYGNLEADSEFKYPYSAGTSLYDKFDIIDRAFNRIDNVLSLDFSALFNLDVATCSTWWMIHSMLESNHFNIYPLHNFLNFKETGDGVNNQFTWDRCFLPVMDVSAGEETSPRFICQYVNGSSSELGIEHDADGSPIAIDCLFISDDEDTPEDFDKTGDDVMVFRVDMSTQGQHYFKSVSSNTKEFSNTHETFRIVDQIAKNSGKTSGVVRTQGVLDIYQRMSVNASVGMMGCMSIQPTQYFELSNAGMFCGTYLITDVAHEITPGGFTTHFQGCRIGPYLVPFAKDWLSGMSRAIGEATGLDDGYTAESIRELLPFSSPNLKRKETAVVYRDDTVLHMRNYYLWRDV